MPKLDKSTDHGHKLVSSEDGQDTLACKISGHSLHAFSGKCPETPPDGRTCRKTFTVGRIDQRTHVQVKRGYFRLRMDGRTDGQPENIMPPATSAGGIKILMSVLGLNSKDRKSTRDKANMSNPKVNRGCTQLTASRISADWVQISLGPSLPYIPLGVYHTGGFNAMCRYRASNIITNLGWPVYIMSDKIELMVSIIHKTQCV